MPENPIPTLAADALAREGTPTKVLDEFCAAYPGGMAIARSVVSGISEKFTEINFDILCMLVLNLEASYKLHEARGAISRAFCAVRDGLDPIGKANCCILCHLTKVGVAEKFLCNPENYIPKLLKRRSRETLPAAVACECVGELYRG